MTSAHSGAARGKPSLLFFVDENLLGLVKRLRMMGIDSSTLPGASDDAVLEVAIQENRIILTKDRKFFERLPDGRGYFVKAEDAKDQLLEVLEQFPLQEYDDALSRCFQCNTPIQAIEKDEVKERVDAKTYSLYEQFYECPTCLRIYWEGSHFDKMVKEVEKVRKELLK
ncbi:DUF5615 family PIN-like protein [Bdellovibrio bacteriovorus]